MLLNCMVFDVNSLLYSDFVAVNLCSDLYSFLSVASFLICSFITLIQRINSRVITDISTSASWLPAFTVKLNPSDGVEVCVSDLNTAHDDNLHMHQE